MFDNPYDTLDVPRDANVDDVRKAYRRHAKAAHPDNGGTVEKFGALRRAHDCLTDPKRRAHFDKTGRDEEPKPDQAEGRAMEKAFMAVAAALQEQEERAFESATGGLYMQVRKPVPKDPLVIAVQKLESVAQEITGRIAQHRKHIEKFEKIAKRFKPKKGKPSLIGPMFAAQANNVRREIEGAKEELGLYQRAIEILKGHTFEDG